MAVAAGEREVLTLVFDLDDCIYPVDNGFTVHRHQEVTGQFLVDILKFPTAAEGMAVRQQYFERYHSTHKALRMAEQEGALPRGSHFDPASLGEYWSEHCDFDKYLEPDLDFIDALKTLPQKKIIFSNGPRKFAVKAMKKLAIKEFFPDENIFCVDDMPAGVCKPEPEAFQHVLSTVGATAATSVMFEDSMKNIRAARACGLGTILITGTGDGEDGVDQTKQKDLPDASDPAVDIALRTVGEIKDKIPSLWDKRM